MSWLVSYWHSRIFLGKIRKNRKISEKKYSPKSGSRTQNHFSDMLTAWKQEMLAHLKRGEELPLNIEFMGLFVHLFLRIWRVGVTNFQTDGEDKAIMETEFAKLESHLTISKQLTNNNWYQRWLKLFRFWKYKITISGLDWEHSWHDI